MKQLLGSIRKNNKPHLFLSAACDLSVECVPSCWPARFALAPVTDYSVIDAWRPRLRADCSALGFPRPALDTDLTRRPTLNALRLPRIAPRLTPCAHADRGSLRVTDCSVIQHFGELRPACGLLRPRCMAFRALLGLLLARRLPLRAAHGLLRARRLALHAGLRIAPYSDISRPGAGPRIAPCPAPEFRTGLRLL